MGNTDGIRSQRLAPWTSGIELDFNETTFTPGMAKREGAVFAGAPMVQGQWDGTGTPDVLTFVRGANLSGHWYANFDPYQGGGFCIFNPEQSSGDRTGLAYLWYVSAAYHMEYDHDNARYSLTVGTQTTTLAQAIAAGTVEYLAWGFDTRNTLDGTNYAYISRNDAQTYGITTQPTVSAPSAANTIGSTGAASPASAILEGLLFVRTVPWTGAYGVDLGVGDIVAMHAAGTDIAETIGAWDSTLSLPTDSAVGALVTGTGEAWSMPHADNVLVDGFGDTAYAASGWADEGTPVALPGLEYNGTTTSCVVTDAAAIQDLHDAAFTAEAWVRADGWGENSAGEILSKGQKWKLYIVSGLGLVGYIDAVTTDAFAYNNATSFNIDSKLHHVCMQYDDGGDRKIYLWVDGVPFAAYASQNPSAGLVVSDVGDDLYHGNRAGSARTWDGLLGGWSRLSDVLRYTNGEAFVPNAPDNPPGADGNTAWQTDYSDGVGAVLTDDSGNGNNGALANHTWGLYRDLSNLQGEQNYEWGYITGSDAANEGITQTLVGLAAGENYVVRTSVTPSADGVARSFIRIRDETNGANIGDFLGPRYVGTHTGANNSATLIDAGARWMQYLVGATLYNITDESSTVITAVSGDGTTITGVLAGGTDNDWDTGDVYRIIWPYVSGYGGYADHPWVETFCFELPTIARNGSVADCVSISVKVMNASTSGLVCLQQLEAYENLVDNPSLETGAGNPHIIDGWTNDGLDAGDASSSAGGGAVIHSGADALQYNAGGAADEGQYVALTATIGDFIAWGAWLYGDAANGPTLTEFGTDETALQSTAATAPAIQSVVAAWAHVPCVVRALSVSPEIELLADGAAALYADDVYAIALDAVSLTVTPASEANSAESAGLRVDGYDLLTQPVNNRLRARSGLLRWRWRPRHDPANLVAFDDGAGNPILVYGWGDANNYFVVWATAANTMQVQFDAAGGGPWNANWACAGAWVEDQELFCELEYTGMWMQFRVDGVPVATVANAVDFATVPATIYWGLLQAGGRQIDAVYKEP